MLGSIGAGTYRCCSCDLSMLGSIGVWGLLVLGSIGAGIYRCELSKNALGIYRCWDLSVLGSIGAGIYMHVPECITYLKLWFRSPVIELCVPCMIAVSNETKDYVHIILCVCLFFCEVRKGS